MKIDVEQNLVAYNGTKMTISEQDQTPARLKDVLIQACLQSQESSGDAKYQTYQLLRRIEKGGEVEVTAEDVAKLKSLIGNSYGVAVVGPVWDALEGKVELVPAPGVPQHRRITGKH